MWEAAVQPAVGADPFQWQSRWEGWECHRENPDKLQKVAPAKGDTGGKVKKWIRRISLSPWGLPRKRHLKDSPSFRYTKGVKIVYNEMSISEDRKINADNHLIVFGLY